jgi:16S rRNA (cytosine1402-N4)-methyltransferase
MHKPVLLNEVLEALNPKENEIFVDATFGAGGYTRAILQKANCKVIAIDRDQNAIKIAEQFKLEFGSRFEFFNTTFSKIDSVLKSQKVDGIVGDFGVSSMQLDTPERGFSFLKEARLDMRMGDGSGLSAEWIVNSTPEVKLAEIIKQYGEERLAKKIANFIARERSVKKIETTTVLAKIITEAYGSEARYTKIHPATKTFQALRIFINNELAEIQELLEKSINLLNKNGRLVLVSFHSLEDGIVKDFIRRNTPIKKKQNKYASFSLKEEQLEEKSHFKVIINDVITPSEEELKENIRSRSAKMRFAIKEDI